MMEDKENHRTLQPTTISRIASEIDIFYTRFKFKHITAAPKFHVKKSSSTAIQKWILSLFFKTNKFLNDNKGIIVSTADKGGKSILMDYSQYHNKMRTFIKDCIIDRIFFPVYDHPLVVRIYVESKYEELRNAINPFLIRDKCSNRESLCYPLPFEPFIISRIYGHLKIHKPKAPIRPIISSIDVIGKNLSSWILNKLKFIAKRFSIHNVINSHDLYKKINHLLISKNHALVTWDYDSMFTNIPFYDVKTIIRGYYHLISPHTSVPVDVFLQAISFFIEGNAYFTYDDVIYRQIKGLSMGNNLSQILAEIFTNYALLKAINSIPEGKLIFIYKFTDDIISCIDDDYVQTMRLAISNFSSDINLKTTLENDDLEVVFLNTTVKKVPYHDDYRITLKWFQRESSCLRILDFHSAHPYYMKRNVINEYVKTALQITTPECWESTILDLHATLKNSNYPSRLIKKAITNMKNLLGSITVTSEIGETDEDILDVYFAYFPPESHFSTETLRMPIRPSHDDIPKRYVSIPNLPSFQQKIKKALKRLNYDSIRLVPVISKNNKNLVFKNLKDKKSLSSIVNASFVIECSNCDFKFKAKASSIDIKRTILHLMNNESSIVHNHIVNFKHQLKPYPINIVQFKNKYELSVYE